MSDWYCSSTAWAAVAQFAASHAYTVGNLVRQLATPTVGNERVFRCTTAGTTAGAEPSWSLGKGATTNSGSAVFTEVTGNSARQHENGVTNSWTAPHARLENMLAWMADGDRGFVSSDHTQTRATSTSFTSFTSARVQSVNRTGSIPPAVGDIASGASITITGGAQVLSLLGGGLWRNLSFTGGTGSNASNNTTVGAGSAGNYDFKDCVFIFGTNSAAAVLYLSRSGGIYRYQNILFTFAATGQSLLPGMGHVTIINATFSGSVPTTIFTLNDALSGGADVEIRDTDFSAFTGTTKIIDTSSGSFSARVKLINCKLSASVVIASISANAADKLWVDVINCDSANTGYRNEWYRGLGTITTETTITRTSGATDGVQKVSHKWVSNSTCARGAALTGPVYSIRNTATGVSKTVTLEFQSNATINNDELAVDVDYQNDASFPLGTYLETLPATLLTSSSAITTSVAGWDASVGSPIYQKLQVTFTAQRAGNVTLRPRLMKPSQTLYLDPHPVIT